MWDQHPDVSPRIPQQALSCHVARVVQTSPTHPEAGQLVLSWVTLGDWDGLLSQILPDQPESWLLHPEAKKNPSREQGPVLGPGPSPAGGHGPRNHAPPTWRASSLDLELFT